MKKDWSNYAVVALLPILLVAVAYTGEAFTRSSFFICSARDSHCESILKNIWTVLKVEGTSDGSDANQAGSDEVRNALALRYSGRMTWFLLREIYLYICIASLGIAAFLIFQWIHGDVRRRMLWTFLILVLAGIVGLFLYRHPQVHMAIFLALFTRVITPDLPDIANLTDRLNSLANAALFSLVVAICILLLPAREASPAESPATDLKEISRRMKSLRLILYTGTLLLVVTLLLKKAIYQWSLAYVPQDGALEAARNLLDAFLTLDGGFYSLVLAAVYLPAALILHRRAQVLVESSLGEPEQETKLKEFGLNFSLRESLPRLLAIIAPFLTGPIAQLFTSNFL